MTDYSEEAAALFARFAERHRLIYSVEPDAPIEVLWEFPEQQGLSFPVTLGLQNGDELNFGVADFWSSFFPFERSASTFEVPTSPRFSHPNCIVWRPMRCSARAMKLCGCRSSD